ncbi:MAG: T9SS type A sorting domain-containing protein [Flavobacteriaceae bacterium]|nr:T9SS type A sorting domain-containing protein [Bacteroidia bacterium]MBT8288136.1 T9SS type A sorting domain-containing protein [Bacteroidia bacterium]NNF74875.1 T9SS type A sorting domain-containing protein [Flavobacteriaceae bacterium]
MKHIYILLTSLLVSFGFAQTDYSGNGNSGFGDVIGSSNLNINDDGTTITFTLTKGTGGFFDALVLYFDTGVSGRSTIDGNVADQADPLRKAISNEDLSNSTLITFPASFEASHAIGLDASFGGLWSIPSTGTIMDNGLVFITSANSDLIDANQAVCTFSINWSDLGLTSSDSFDFVGLYLNASNAFSSDEGYGDGIAPGNPGGGTITYTGSRTYSNTLGLDESNYLDLNISYLNEKLKINGLDGFFNVSVYDMLGRTIVSLKNEQIFDGYINRLQLNKGQLFILKIENEEFKKTLKIIAR